ncbi:hypothetical protein BH10ACI1_BH10ACI1_16550 [soil metagenome]
MKNLTKKLLILVGLIIIAGAVNEAQAQSGVICSMPGDCEPVFKFKKWDLAFSTGRKSTFKSGETAESNEFYAVVLDSVKIGFSEGDYCNNFSETKRLTAQKVFPKNKVFASHYCELENVIIYTGYSDWHEQNLLAVFIGEVGDEDNPLAVSEADAQAFLKKAKAKYPKAALVKMQAVIDYTRR